MATLQKIRNKGGVLVAVIIGLALLAFILGDMLNHGPSIFSRKRLEVAEIDGNSINIMDYNRKIDELSEFYKRSYNIQSLDNQTLENIKDETWKSTLRDIILGKSYKSLGIDVSNDELITMLQGDSINSNGVNVVMDEPHPIIKSWFTNPETGEFNRFQMVNYFNAISNPAYADEQKRWIYLENQIVDERMSQKYFTLIQKGIQPSLLDAKYYAQESASTIDFNYVYESFTTVSDDKVSVSDAEVEKYYDKHKNEYKQIDGRSIEYVVFELLPSQKDDDNARTYVSESKTPFQRAESAITFVNSVSDKPYVDKFYSKSDLSPVIADSIFNAAPGFVAGPYFENGSYKLSRLIEFDNVPDSVRARHILISLSVQRDETRAKEIADSLKNLIVNGADFNTLARDFSADDNNKNIGGDLGWFTADRMVKPFSDACFTGKTGDLDVVKTKFGYHVIKIEAQSPRVKKAKVATLEREVLSSDETNQEIYSKAVDFTAKSTDLDKFRASYEAEKITPRFATDFGPNELALPGLESSREIIRWAYENEKGSVSHIFDLGDRYVVAALTDVKKKGFAPLESVKSEIETAIKKEKKMEILSSDIKSKLASATTIDQAASNLGLEVNEATKVRFTNPYVNPVGLEPVVVSEAFTMSQGQLSAPIIGANGVFVIQIINIDTPAQPDIASAEFRLKYGLRSRVAYEGYEALQDKADIVDERIKFF
ncbi:MAG: peptidylprolyl isomerase [Bacteroidales bacterium]|nr:peptidylprolyl isomerase [Bacteroidales bacterium]MCB9012983.1 peptidylprolyl isomerase [Bacteroidales bacterium]